MKKSTFISLLAVAGGLLAGAQTVEAQTYMEDGTLFWGNLYTSFPPSSASVTWDNQEIELTDPATDEYGDEYGVAYIQLGDGEKQEVNAYVMSSFGDPDDPDDPDLWFVDFAFYNIDNLWDFNGDTITLIIPEGLVKNVAGDVNPAQDLVFHLMPTYTDYEADPETGSTITSENLTVKVSFGGNPIEYIQDQVRLSSYEDYSYKEIILEYGKDVTINEDNEIVIDLSSVESGEYELLIPEAYVFVKEDGKDYINPDIWFEYTIENDGVDTGIDSINTNNSHLNVYTINGANLGKVNSTENLNKGIYIINGKKVLVKK